MTNRTLLPPSATQLEKNLSYAMICDPPIHLRSLWDPKVCPFELLPYLAWQYSVDRWDENWLEQTKRKVISEAFEIHKVKGTKEAIRRAVEPFGYLIRVVEWWENDTAPGTFSIDIGISDHGVTNESYSELTRIIEDVKPASRHLSGLSLHMITNGTINVGAICFDGNTLTIYPYLGKTIITMSEHPIGIAIHSINTVSVYPHIQNSITTSSKKQAAAIIHIIDTMRITQ